jgi:hypothetical protein
MADLVEQTTPYRDVPGSWRMDVVPEYKDGVRCGLRNMVVVRCGTCLFGWAIDTKHTIAADGTVAPDLACVSATYCARTGRTCSVAGPTKLLGWVPPA